MGADVFGLDEWQELGRRLLKSSPERFAVACQKMQRVADALEHEQATNTDLVTFLTRTKQRATG